MGKPLAWPMWAAKPCGSPCSITAAAALTARALEATHWSMAMVLPAVMASRSCSMVWNVLPRTMWYVAAPVMARAPTTVAVLMARILERRRSEEHTSELQSRLHLVCRLLLEKKNEVEVHCHGGGFRRAIVPSGASTG